jgi:hypothetical protein
MTYNAGQVILTDQYNTFVEGSDVGPLHTVANVNSIWGVGNGNKGWGQTSTLTPVTNELVTATQWSTLFDRFDAIATQQGTSVTGITNPVAGEVITAIATFESELSTLYTNRFNNTGFGNDNAAVTNTPTFTQYSYHTITYTTGTADQMRYFFNAGGVLDMYFTSNGSAVGGSASGPKNDEWKDLVEKCGTLRMDHDGFSKIGGSGAHTITDVGYYGLTTGYQSIFKQFADSSPYLTNYVEVFARVASIDGTNADNGKTIQFEVRFVDAQVGTFNDDPVDSPITTVSLVRPAAQLGITASWGSPAAHTAIPTASA